MRTTAAGRARLPEAMATTPPPTQLRSRTGRLSVSLTVALALIGALALTVYAATGGRGRKAQAPKLEISGRLSVPLRPGLSQPIDLRIANRYAFGVRLNLLTVKLSVDRAHRRAGCRAKRDFFVWQVPRREYPIRVDPASTQRLNELGVQALPEIEMRNLADVNQDGCQGAVLKLRYTAIALRDGAKRRSSARG